MVVKSEEECGNRVSFMVKEKKLLQMVRITLVCLKMEKSMVKEHISGLINHSIQVNGVMTLLMVQELTLGMMEESMKANGRKIS